MLKKALVLLLIFAVFLSMGCIRKNDSPQVVTPSVTPPKAATPTPAPWSTPLVTPTVKPTASPSSNWTYFDPSLVDFSGEGTDTYDDNIFPTPGEF